jgi:hypothetical protein
MKDKFKTKILDDDQMPLFPKEWLIKLQQMFPDECPKPEWQDRKIWTAVGERNVVRYLEERYANQHRSN